MNPLLARLQPYPFERLRQLHAKVTPNPALRPISLGIGEPRHAVSGCQDIAASFAHLPTVRWRAQTSHNALGQEYSPVD